MSGPGPVTTATPGGALAAHPRPHVVVLGYHGLSDTWPDETAVTPRRFAEQVEAFLDRGYVGATFSDALTAPAGRKTLAVTFDDAAESVHRHGFQVLERLEVPATMFVPTDYPDSGRPLAWRGFDRWIGGPHEHELDCMSWERLGYLRDRGWEIGSHTLSHPLLTGLDDETLERELVESRRVCRDRLGVACAALAYPYGVADARVARAARAAGYLAAATLPDAPARPLPLLWPRVGVYRGDSVRRVRMRAFRRAVGAAPRRL